MLERRNLLGLLLVLFLAAVVRFSGITFDSLWLDESYQSLAGAYGHGVPDFTAVRDRPLLFRFENPAPAGEMLRRFRDVDPLCPPLYQLLLNRWLCCFGDSDFAVRSLGVVISLLSVVSVYFFGAALFGSGTGLLAAGLLAVSPYDVHYAQEARMYSLVAFSGLVSSGTLILLVRERPIKWRLVALVTYSVSGWALINSHYTGLFLLAAQCAAASLFLVWKRRWRLLFELCLSWLLVMLLWLPWLPMFFQSASIRKESFYVSRQPGLWWPFYALFVRVPVNWLSFLSGNRVVAWAAPVYATSALMLASAARFALRGIADSHRFSILCCALWAVVPPVGIWLLDVLENHRVVEISRYTIATLPAVVLVAGWGLSRLLQQRRSWWWLVAVHLVFAGVNLVYAHTVHQREPWREMARAVEQRCRPGDLVLVSQYYDIACLDRYLSRPQRQTGVSPSMGREHIGRVLAGVDRFLLVTAQEGESIVELVPERYGVVDEKHLSHGLHLRVYQEQ